MSDGTIKSGGILFDSQCLFSHSKLYVYQTDGMLEYGSLKEDH